MSLIDESGTTASRMQYYETGTEALALGRIPSDTCARSWTQNRFGPSTFRRNEIAENSTNN